MENKNKGKENGETLIHFSCRSLPKIHVSRIVKSVQ